MVQAADLSQRVANLERQIATIQGTPSGKALLLYGKIMVPLGTGARTDKGSDGEIHAYISGSSVFFGMYMLALGTWVYAEMT